LELEDEEVLGGVGFVVVEAVVAADFPDVFEGVDAGDGWGVDEFEVAEDETAFGEGGGEGGEEGFLDGFDDGGHGDFVLVEDAPRFEG